MPTYEYGCKNCGHRFEEFQRMSDDPITQCPECGEESVQRLVSGGAGLIFKGSGFYITDYKNKNSSPGNGSGEQDGRSASDSKSSGSGSENAGAKKESAKSSDNS
ncbi:MAG: hypothetical protein MAGBODY4_01552 [Candidatus Marinimicrobia bacterium]|nr:hypothetical protein [Candidatus Neomarinimicrobiota bacterium]